MHGVVITSNENNRGGFYGGPLVSKNGQNFKRCRYRGAFGTEREAQVKGLSGQINDVSEQIIMFDRRVG